MGSFWELGLGNLWEFPSKLIPKIPPSQIGARNPLGIPSKIHPPQIPRSQIGVPLGIGAGNSLQKSSPKFPDPKSGLGIPSKTYPQIPPSQIGVPTAPQLSIPIFWFIPAPKIPRNATPTWIYIHRRDLPSHPSAPRFGDTPGIWDWGIPALPFPWE